MAARPRPVTVDVRRDGQGEYFDIELASDAPELQVLQSRPRDKHLLLFARGEGRFLCGFDERHWFVAGIEGGVSTIRDAKVSLMPDAGMRRRAYGNPSLVNRRRNREFIRQGEWFFVHARVDVPPDLILRNEPIQRGMGKAHMCEELYRRGGAKVYVVGSQVLSEQAYRKRVRKDPDFGRRGVRAMMRDPAVFVRGAVRHADHATVKLADWHRVLINGERTTSSVAFLD
jgi:hypothetical protein